MFISNNYGQLVYQAFIRSGFGPSFKIESLFVYGSIESPKIESVQLWNRVNIFYRHQTRQNRNSQIVGMMQF